MLLYDGHCTDCPARLVQARSGEPRRNPQRVLERAGVGAALADDIEGGAVRGRVGCVRAECCWRRHIELSAFRGEAAPCVFLTG